MTNTNRPMTLKFSLEETVWFRKGDEIQELINISLEPNVTIQELNHFITIQGSLELHGEYKSAEPSDEQDETLSFTGQKFANVLETRDAGISEFSYHFPVDITIPKMRVKNMDEIDLLIDLFDYRIVEKNCLEVSTDLLVTGVYNDIPTNDSTETKERDTDEKWTSDFIENEQYYNRPETESSLTPLEDLEEEPFDISVEKTKREESEVDNDEPHEQIPIQIFHHPTDDIEELTLESIDHTVEKKIEEEKKMEHQSLTKEEKENRITGKRVESTDQLDANEGDLEEKELVSKKVDVPNEGKGFVNRDDHQKESENKENVELVGSNRREMISQRELEQFWHEDTVQSKDLEESMAFRSNSSNDVSWPEEPIGMASEREESKLTEGMETNHENKELDREEKNIHYQSQENTTVEEKPISLTEYFARKEEPKSTRLTVYIVQEDDQLSDIAEKYDIQISQLLRMNRLDTQHELYEGQVLLIPQNDKVVYSDD